MGLFSYFRRLHFIWVVLVLFYSPAYAGDPRSMTFDPVSMDPPKTERIELLTGMKLFLLEDHELPLVNIHVMIRTGSIYETADQVGLAELTGKVLTGGGTRHLTGEEVNEALEFMAADLDIGIGSEHGDANLNVLKKDLDRGLHLFSEILVHPAFAEDKVEFSKRQMIETIRRRNDSPASIAGRLFRKLLYGRDHPLGRESTVEGIQSLQRKDLIAFHQKYFHPNNAMIAVSGDVTREEIIKTLNEAFAEWDPQPVGFPQVPAVQKVFEPSVHYAYKDVPQTTIRIGHLGIKRDNPDFFALSVMNDILGGGGFSSRLVQEIRRSKGLAYSAGSIFSPGNLDVGVFLAYSETKSSSTLQAISSIIEEIKRIREKPVDSEELKLAKDSFLNSFVFSFASPAQVAIRQMRLAYYGFPEDYLQTFRDQVAQVTQEDILRVAREYLHPEGLIILTVGRQEEFEGPLSTFGKVQEIPLEEEAPVTGG